MSELNELKNNWTGSAEERQKLQKLLASRREEKGDHALWGSFCEKIGEDHLAVTEYQLALRDDPHNVLALSRLAFLLPERGDLESALRYAQTWLTLSDQKEPPLAVVIDLCIQLGLISRAADFLHQAIPAGLSTLFVEQAKARLKAAQKEQGEESPVTTAVEEPSFTESDVIRFAYLFAGRENIYARQWVNTAGETGYSPVREPFTFKAARNHLLGIITVGIYPVRLDNTVNYFVFDIDINKGALEKARGSIQKARELKEQVATETLRLRQLLLDLQIDCIMEDSGYKGRHLWVFLRAPIEADIVRQFGNLFLASHPLKSKDLHVEFFPKQSGTGTGIGNLIKLPLGIHRKTGRRSRFLLPDGRPDPDPFASLKAVSPIPSSHLMEIIVQLKKTAQSGVPQSPGQTQQVPAPVPVTSPEPPWTAADFQTNPEISCILKGCPVLQALKKRAEEKKRLTHDEQIVLRHSLGHSAAGVKAVNYLLDLCVDVRVSAILQSPLAGNPISCPKIRKRIPHITSTVPCNCLFDFAPDEYPNPRLHLRKLPSKLMNTSSRKDPGIMVKNLLLLRNQSHRLQQEIQELEDILQRFIQQSGSDRIVVPEGALVLKTEEGTISVLVWEPAPVPPDQKDR